MISLKGFGTNSLRFITVCIFLMTIGLASGWVVFVSNLTFAHQVALVIVGVILQFGIGSMYHNEDASFPLTLESVSAVGVLFFVNLGIGWIYFVSGWAVAAMITMCAFGVIIQHFALFMHYVVSR